MRLRRRTWNPLSKSPIMTAQYAQSRALLGSQVAINCHRLSQITIELLHFCCTHSGLSPPSLGLWEAAGREVCVSPQSRDKPWPVCVFVLVILVE